MKVLYFLNFEYDSYLINNISNLERIQLVKRRKLFLSSDTWSPRAGFFPIGNHKLLKWCRKEDL